jgi:hypothetical protein
MKIVKEVIIKAAMNDTWSLLIEDEALLTLQKSKSEAKKSTIHSPHGSGATVIISDPPRKLSFNGGAISPKITTTFELAESGNRTGLKVTISGWETVDPETARLEMPRVSLAWEKKLGLLKKAVESASITRQKTLKD